MPRARRRANNPGTPSAPGPGSRFYVPPTFDEGPARTGGEGSRSDIVIASIKWIGRITLSFVWGLVLLFFALFLYFLASVYSVIRYLPWLRPRPAEDEGFFNGNGNESREDFFERLRARTGARGGGDGRAGAGGGSAAAATDNGPPIVVPTDPVQAVERIMRENEHDLYRILGASREATVDEMKKLFRRQSLLVHPDKNQHKNAMEAFKRLSHAYELLGDEESRKKYDEEVQDVSVTGEELRVFMEEFVRELQKRREQYRNSIFCDVCENWHERQPTTRSVTAARLCDEHSLRHPAKEGDIWAERTNYGFAWNLYLRADGAVWDITELGICQGLKNRMASNTHRVWMKMTQRPRRGKQSDNIDEDLERILREMGQEE